MFSTSPNCHPRTNILHLEHKKRRRRLNQENREDDPSMLLIFLTKNCHDARSTSCSMPNRAPTENTRFQPLQDFNVELSTDCLAQRNELKMIQNATGIKKLTLMLDLAFFDFFCSLIATFLLLHILWLEFRAVLVKPRLVSGYNPVKKTVPCFEVIQFEDVIPRWTTRLLKNLMEDELAEIYFMGGKYFEGDNVKLLN